MHIAYTAGVRVVAHLGRNTHCTAGVALSRLATIPCLLLLMSSTGCLGEFDASSFDTEPPSAECSLCHGDVETSAPPRALTGDMGTSNVGVGAHRNHLDPDPTWHRVVQCNDCHAVPATSSAPGHMDDGDNRAELSFSALAGAADWNGTTCENAYCHGATLTGGALTTPEWTKVDGTQDACGNCHGAPPPAPHPESDDCGSCHRTMQPGDNRTFLDPDSHMNGVLDLGDDVSGAGCDSCHGSDGISAPPKDLLGNTDRASVGVGAHREHLGTSDWRREIFCSDCHSVPTSVDTPGHMDGDNKAELIFAALNAEASYAGGTCSNLYCHGTGRAPNGTMSWTAAGTLECTSCHGTNAGGPDLSGDHNKHFREGVQQCDECHDAVVARDLTVDAPNMHLNGLNEVQMKTGGVYDPSNRRCSGMACHGNETW